MFSATKNKFLLLLQLLLVFIYIIFEELIWEGIAKPVYEFVHSLKILQKVETKLHSANASVILIIFIFLLGVVEAFGIYAGILFVSGNVLLGLALYISKVPVAAFTFWMFRVTEDKLMTFGWFKWLYEKIMLAIDWLKSREMYMRIMERLKSVKKRIKNYVEVFKEKYFSKKNSFMAKVKSLYRAIKASLKK